MMSTIIVKKRARARERERENLARGAEVAGSGAREERDKGAEVVAGGTLVGGGKAGVQNLEGYPTCRFGDKGRM